MFRIFPARLRAEIWGDCLIISMAKRAILSTLQPKGNLGVPKPDWVTPSVQNTIRSPFMGVKEHTLIFLEQLVSPLGTIYLESVGLRILRSRITMHSGFS